MATNRTRRWGSSSRSSRGSRRRTTVRSSGKRAARGYESVSNSFSQRIASYKCLTTQTVGAARTTRPSPATLTSMSRLIEKGAVIQKVSATQVRRWSNTSRTPKSAASAKTVMQRRFGKGIIKAVATDKSGGAA